MDHSVLRGGSGFVFLSFLRFGGEAAKRTLRLHMDYLKVFSFLAFGGIAQVVEGEGLHYFTGEELLRIFFSFLDAKWQHE